MSKSPSIFLPVALSVALSLGLFYALNLMNPAGKTNHKESTYERVMRTQTINCGWGQWPPYISKDISTGKFSGIIFDYMEALGAALNLKIVWGEEFGSADFMPALRGGRIDGLCAGIWPNAARAREMDFTTPIYYSPMDAYVRADDVRFDNALARLDDPSVTIVVADGEMAALIATTDFPRAKRLELPQLSSIAEFFLNIALGKADVTFANPAMFALYDKQNPGKLRRVPNATPLRIFGNTIAIDAGQERFRRMIDLATEELLSSGKIDKILDKYKPDSDGLVRAARPYQR